MPSAAQLAQAQTELLLSKEQVSSFYSRFGWCWFLPRYVPVPLRETGCCCSPRSILLLLLLTVAALLRCLGGAGAATLLYEEATTTNAMNHKNEIISLPGLLLMRIHLALFVIFKTAPAPGRVAARNNHHKMSNNYSTNKNYTNNNSSSAWSSCCACGHSRPGSPFRNLILLSTSSSPPFNCIATPITNPPN
ncbi:hypothetical protein T492DRAFT_401867 [Pavlovales sp. CCMP2436]|nr:hypothetical protein T492DRAFT_401867 [Pavlovales sp. CCMP2436]